MRTVVALSRYVALDAARSARLLTPLLLYFLCVTVLYANTGGDVQAAYALPAMLMSPIAAWLTLGVLTLEGPEQAAVTAAAGGGHRRVAAAQVLVIMTLCATIAVASCIGGSLAYRSTSLATVATGATAHLCCAGQGVALTLVASRFIWRSKAIANTLVVAFQLAVLAIPASASRVNAAALSRRTGQETLIWLAPCAAAVLVGVLATTALLGAIKSRPSIVS